MLISVPRYTYDSVQGSIAPTSGWITVTDDAWNLGFRFRIKERRRFVGHRVYHKAGERGTSIVQVWNPDTLDVVINGIAPVTNANRPMAADGWLNLYSRPQPELAIGQDYILQVAISAGTSIKTTFEKLNDPIDTDSLHVYGVLESGGGGYFVTGASLNNPIGPVSAHLYGVDILLSDVVV